MQRSYDKMMFYKLVAHLMENPNLKFFSGKCEQISRKRTNYHKLYLLTPEITASRNRNDKFFLRNESKHKKATTIL